MKTANAGELELRCLHLIPKRQGTHIVCLLRYQLRPKGGVAWPSWATASTECVLKWNSTGLSLPSLSTAKPSSSQNQKSQSVHGKQSAGDMRVAPVEQTHRCLAGDLLLLLHRINVQTRIQLRAHYSPRGLVLTVMDFTLRDDGSLATS